MGSNNHTGIDIGTSNANPQVFSLCKGTVKYNTTSGNYSSQYDKYWNAFLVIAHDCNNDGNVDIIGYYGHIISSLSVSSTVSSGGIAIGTIRDAYDKYNNINKSSNHLHLSISQPSKIFSNEWGYYGASCSAVGDRGFLNPISYFRFNSVSLPGSVSVSPTSSTWTTSPQNISVNSSNATQIYYTIRYTSDGSTPVDPPEPSSSVKDGTITGSSGNFQVYASIGQIKRLKVRFRGYNGAGYSASTASYLYTIDLRSNVPSKPDLIATALTASSSVEPGGKVTINLTIKNQGGANAGASRAKFYLSTNNTISTSDIDTGWYCDISALSANATYTCSGPVGIPSSVSLQNYYIGVIVDANRQITESNEDNNTRAASSVTSVTRPDLIATTMTTSTSGQVGGQITISSIVKNQGAVTAGASRLIVYFSTDNIIDPWDYTNRWGCDIPALAPNATFTCSGPIPIPVRSGNYYVGVIVDANRQVTESNEYNNTRAASSITSIR
ncbi:MAG: hypothetical protein KDJ28_17090 [Candidatus Competibacteraceae bacterium]|nr:hypothetical protein [Candidatus Competibacteraceae bacterium]